MNTKASPQRTRTGQFTGAGAFPASQPAMAPNYISLDTAGERLSAAFKVADATLRSSEVDQVHVPAAVIRASPGAGKSTMMRRHIAEQADENERIAFHVPTLKLAEEACADMTSLGIDTTVIRGRSAARPDGTGQMCAKAELVERAGKLGISARDSFCERKVEGGTVQRCPHFESCAYLDQFRGPAGHTVMTTSYLTLPDPSGQNYTTRIVDETFWQQHISICDVSVVEFTAPRTYLPASYVARHTALLTAARKVVSALIEGRSPLSLPMSAEDLDEYAQLEWQGKATPPEISPDQDFRRQANAVKLAEQGHRRVSRFATIWKVLAEAKRNDCDDCERLRLYVLDDRHILRVMRKQAPRHKEPTVILDADADADILSALGYGIVCEHSAQLRPNAIVRQLHDRRMTNGSLLSKPGLRECWRRIICREVFENRQEGDAGVLVGATRKVVRKFFEDAGYGTKFADMCDDEISDFMLNTQLHGASWLWFGGRALGSNRYKDFGRVVVIGREELPLQALEDQGRAIFGDTPGAPLKLLTGDPSNHTLPEAEIPYEMTDGSNMAVKVPCHPDPRIRRLQNQARECATRQLIERLRLARAAAPKKVLIGCNIPIPGIPVDTLLSWEDLCPDRISAAIVDGLLGCGGVRLTVQGLSDAAPTIFENQEAARKHVQRSGSRPPFGTEINDVVGRNHVHYGRLRAARPRARLESALLIGPVVELQDRAEALWGPMSEFQVTRHSQE